MSALNRTYGGRYAVLERVGSGGMAEVYRARDELLGRMVAVKVLSERFSRDRSFVERFRREAQSAANLNHPNIVSLFDYGADDGTYFIVMEFIDGRSLSDIIGDEGPLMPERAAEITSDVAKALQRAHVSGLVHRDIKSSNIMITRSGQTKVTDFGIARALGGDGESTMTQTGMVMGTAAYLSPEQAQGNPVDARSDVYSLGIVLYEMLTGSTPFAGDSPLAIAYKHVREEPRPPSSVNPDVPQALDAITLKALAKNPDNRYSSAAELDEDIQRFISGQRVHATPLMADETSVMGVGTGTQILEPIADERPDYEQKPSRAGWYVVVALLVLGLVGLLAWLLADNLFGGGDVEVPRVVGLSESEAGDLLQDRGLEADVVERRNSPRRAGRVIDQDPNPGAQIEEGGTVELVVSRGPRQVTVPSLEGITEEEARDRLQQADLKVGRVDQEPSEEFEPGLVIGQDPAADEEVNAGTEVDITVSSGPETVTVPGVVGLTEGEAIEALNDVGLSANTIRAPDDAPEGEVIAQDPAEGSEAAVDDVVTITISEGIEEQAMPNVVGQVAADAAASLEEEFGLEVELLEETEECAQPPGTVCRQDPLPETPVSEGDAVTLFVLDVGD